MLEHPLVTQINRTGYPNLIAQKEHCGIDFFGEEILSGDEIVEIDDEVILKDNLERFLHEEYNAKFTTAI